MIPPFPADRPGRALASRRGAFTIVELLVAITIGIVVIVLLAGIVWQSMWLARKAGSTLQAMNAAAAAMDLIAGDLDGLAASRGPSEYLQALMEPVAIGPAGATCQPMRLLMLSCSAEDASTSSTGGGIYTYPDSGLVHAVSYSILYQDPLGGANSNSIFGLYRAVVSSTTTFTSILGGTNEYTSYWSNSGNNVSALVSNPQPQSGIKADFVAPNVVDLEVAIDGNLVSSASPSVLTGSTQIMNPGQAAGSPFVSIQLYGTGVSQGVAYDANGAVLSSGSSPSPAILPKGVGWGSAAYAEVSVTVLEDEGATLWALGKNEGGLSTAILKQKYGHTLTRKIFLRPQQ